MWCGDLGRVIHTSHFPTPRQLVRPHHIPHSTTPHHPISPHIDEDAIEGVYFAFSLILRCLPYFCEKTRPRGSYELLEAFSPSCGECGGLPSPPQSQNAHTWEPGILKVGLSITREPLSRPSDWGSQGGASRPSESDNPHPARPILSPPHPARPHPQPERPHPHTPTRTPHTRTPHTQRKKT